MSIPIVTDRDNGGIAIVFNTKSRIGDGSITLFLSEHEREGLLLQLIRDKRNRKAGFFRFFCYHVMWFRRVLT